MHACAICSVMCNSRLFLLVGDSPAARDDGHALLISLDVLQPVAIFSDVIILTISVQVTTQTAHCVVPYVGNANLASALSVKQHGCTEIGVNSDVFTIDADGSILNLFVWQCYQDTIYLGYKTAHVTQKSGSYMVSLNLYYE